MQYKTKILRTCVFNLAANRVYNNVSEVRLQKIFNSVFLVHDNTRMRQLPTLHNALYPVQTSSRGKQAPNLAAKTSNEQREKRNFTECLALRVVLCSAIPSAIRASFPPAFYKRKKDPLKWFRPPMEQLFSSTPLPPLFEIPLYLFLFYYLPHLHLRLLFGPRDL